MLDGLDSAKREAFVLYELEALPMTDVASILDLDHIADEADFGAVTAVPEEILEDLYGTIQPTRAMIEKNMDFFEGIDRGQGIYIVAYKNGQPHEILFAGYSFVQPFQSGVNDLGRDVKEILSTGSIGGVGRGGSVGNGGTAGGPLAPTGTSGTPTAGGGTMNPRVTIPTDTQAPNLGPRRIPSDSSSICRAVSRVESSCFA